MIVHDEEPRPGDGEESYVGKGLRAGRAALIMGRDPGIGRAVPIAYAREGADVAIAYRETDRTCWLRRGSR